VLDKLEFLLALARERHFGRAAEACGVTQPSLSAGIKQLEESFGILLVNRGSRFHDFTAEGERVLDWARRIVGDTHAMREDIHALKHGLTGRLRIAAIPMALAMVETLTTLYRERHPAVQFTVLAANSEEIFGLLDNLKIDAGVTYLDDAPPGRLSSVPLYRERFCLVTAADASLGERDTVSWAEVAQLPLCLLTPDTQSRRIIETLIRQVGGDPRPDLESNSMIVLYSHVRTGRWATVMPATLAATLGLTDEMRAIPIVQPEASHTIGLVVPARQPMKPLTAALVAESKRAAQHFADQPEQRDSSRLPVGPIPARGAADSAGQFPSDAAARSDLPLER
jgi:DNA-binding transcriptional LysR family regulator